MTSNGKANFIFVISVSIICIILWFLPTGFENPALTNSTLREKAKIISVNNDDLETHAVVTVGTQFVTMVIESGKFEGDTVKSGNTLMGQMKIDKIYKPGDKVLAIIKTDPVTGKLKSARPDDLFRLDYEIILFVLFAVFLIGFAKWTGLKALLSFVFTALAIWKILLPMYLKGYPPIPLAFIIISITTTVIILLISGFNRKGLVALSGSVTGIGLTTAMAILFGHFFRIPGTVMEFSDAILYAGFGTLNLSDIFLTGIFISAAGAVMDVAMDIAASQNELIQKKPELSRNELIKSGFSIAYPVIGTMTTTLLFAYSGSFMFVFMLFMAKGSPMSTVFNTNYIAAEVLHTVVGSFGLVLVAPATAIIGGFIYKFKSNVPN